MKAHNNNGFSFAELLMVIAISSIMLTGIFSALITGQATWFTADTSIELRNNIRQAGEKIARELRESGFNANGVSQVTIGDNTGFGSSDTLRFSMPVICQAGTSLLNATGDVANWGAPLTWGCTSSSCMDANDSCAALEYKYIQYEIDSSNQLIRKILDPALTTVREDVIAPNMSNMQLTTSVDQNVITVALTAQKLSAMRKLLNLTKSVDVFLRNRG